MGMSQCREDIAIRSFARVTGTVQMLVACQALAQALGVQVEQTDHKPLTKIYARGTPISNTNMIKWGRVI